MKIYITADIEGVTGVAHWDETAKAHADYVQFQERMTAEVCAACDGAIEAGATEIWVKDAHGSGRNILIDELPDRVRLIRGWSGHPYSMVQNLDERFDALVFVGYHSAATAAGNPLSHTFSGTFNRIELNGERMSEFRCNSLTGRSHGVPSVFLSGDKALCDEAVKWAPHLKTVVTLEGIGRSTISQHPALTLNQIRSGVAEGITARQPPDAMPDQFRLDIRYRQHMDAYRFSFFPGAEQMSDDTIRFETDTWFEVVRALRFAR